MTSVNSTTSESVNSFELPKLKQNIEWSELKERVIQLEIKTSLLGLVYLLKKDVVELNVRNHLNKFLGFNHLSIRQFIRIRLATGGLVVVVHLVELVISKNFPKFYAKVDGGFKKTADRVDAVVSNLFHCRLNKDINMETEEFGKGKYFFIDLKYRTIEMIRNPIKSLLFATLLIPSPAGMGCVTYFVALSVNYLIRSCLADVADFIIRKTIFHKTPLSEGVGPFLGVIRDVNSVVNSSQVQMPDGSFRPLQTSQDLVDLYFQENLKHPPTATQKKVFIKILSDLGLKVEHSTANTIRECV